MFPFMQAAVHHLSPPLFRLNVTIFTSTTSPIQLRRCNSFSVNSLRSQIPIAFQRHSDDVSNMVKTQRNPHILFRLLMKKGDGGDSDENKGDDEGHAPPIGTRGREERSREARVFQTLPKHKRIFAISC
ncbi:unnamed protein product [Vicia faba]|uniref:Uncharacterized protein n=1 Tax=Vicia faba TaxID=3906 RepID=A0AAV0Z0G8_VICFA|nr:unnamed protein product [Vicia faba]